MSRNSRRITNADHGATVLQAGADVNQFMRRCARPRISPPTRTSVRRVHMSSAPSAAKTWDPSELISLETFRRLPKAELHRHLDGCLRVSTVIELAREQNISLPTFDAAELRKLVAVDKLKGVASLVEYLRGFDIVLPVLQKPYAITRAMYEACEDAAKDGVRYLEVRFSPILHVNEGASLSSVMEAVCVMTLIMLTEGANMAESHFPIVVRIIVIGMRQLPPALTTHLAEIAWRYREKGVAGFDIAGPEYGFSSKLFKEAFSLVRHQNVNCTLHAGEAAGPESIRDAIRYCGAHRIGHGVTLQQDSALMQYVADHGIAIECCPTSNCHTKAIHRCEDHPIRRYYDAGIIVVPCCDNSTVSDVTLSGEYCLVQEKFQFTTKEIARIIDYGFRASFMENGRKHRMRADVARACVDVLRSEGRDVSGIVNDPYWLRMGIDLRGVGSVPYWGNHVNPQISSNILRALPKADLHCRLDGSVSIPTVWKAFQEAKLSLHTFGYLGETSFEILKTKPTRPEELKQLKLLLNSVLQTQGALRMAVEDVLTTAVADGVRYLELQIRPSAHTAGGLSMKEGLRTILDAKSAFEKAHSSISVGIVLFCNSLDDPLIAYETAQLAVGEREAGVVGFGFYCSVLEADHFSFYRATFDFLKEKNMDATIFARSPQSVVAALEAGAARINGAFDAHMNTGLMNHLANHNVPVEVGLTTEYEIWTRDLRTFVHPVRLFLDKGVPITLCSFRGLFGPSRIEALDILVTECKMTIAELLKLIGHSFAFNFQSLRRREAMLDEVWKENEAVLKPAGFKYLLKHYWFPSSTQGTLLSATQQEKISP